MRLRGPQAVQGGHLCRLPHRKAGRPTTTGGAGGPGRHGYPLIWAPEHPRTGNGKYVFEHVLVMEETLGRYLVPGENVHHRNGVRDDNRPENLELWSTPQPTGIRASDAHAWAREIIARYGDETLTQGN
jgi:HNH endonuclease